MQSQAAPVPRGGFVQVVGDRWWELCDRLELSPGAERLLMRLLTYADRRTEAVGFYSQRSWAEALRCTPAHLRKLQRELEAKGCIRVRRLPGSYCSEVQLLCWADVVQAERTRAHSVRPSSAQRAHQVGTACPDVQGFRAPIGREIDTAPDVAPGVSSDQVVTDVLEACRRSTRAEAERWVTERIGEGVALELLQRVTADARADGKVLWVSWLTKRLQRYQAEPVRPAEPAAPAWCDPCWEVHSTALPVHACRCPDVLENHLATDPGLEGGSAPAPSSWLATDPGLVGVAS
jgi:hypothetical protein